MPLSLIRVSKRDSLHTPNKEAPKAGGNGSIGDLALTNYRDNHAPYRQRRVTYPARLGEREC